MKMGFIIGILKKILKLIICFGIFVTAVLLIPNLPPYTKFTDIKVEETQPRTGVLSPNGALNNAQKLFHNKLLGPEAFRIFNGDLYTGLATGEIVKISLGGHITYVTKIGQPCTGLIQEHICGRPLGFEIDGNTKNMYVADAYHGIWKVDLKTDKKQVLVSPNVEIDGKLPKIFNSIALDRNGNLFWTHSSSDYDLKDGALTPLSDPSGRLLYYNSKTNQSKVLLDNLWFANGVIISPDNQFVLVAESNLFRIMKYYINGQNSGKSEVFISGIPGMPDNLQVLPDGSGVLVSLYVVFDDDNPLISHSLAGTPLARKFLARLIRLVEIPFEFLNEQFPHVIFEEIIYKIGHISSLSAMTPQMSGLLQLDWNGNIVASYYNSDKSINTASDAIVFNDKLYIGNPHSPYISLTAVPSPLKKAFSKTKTPSSSAVKKDEVKKVPQAKVEVAPKAEKIKSPENDQIKLSETKQVPTIPKTTDQLPPKSNKIRETSEQKPNIQSQNIKETKQSSKKGTIEEKGSKEEIKVQQKLNEKQTIKQETETKPKAVDKQVKKEQAIPNTKSTENKPIKQGTVPNTKSGDQMKTNQRAATKPIEAKEINVKKNVDTNILKEEMKYNMLKEEKSSTKKSTETPVNINTGDNKSKQSKDTKESNIKDNISSEPVKAPHVKPSVTPSEQSTKSKVKATSKTKPTNGPQKSVPDQIPVKEEIPSDRAKPPRETLKVIKKSGPVEIPNPN